MSNCHFRMLGLALGLSLGSGCAPTHPPEPTAPALATFPADQIRIELPADHSTVSVVIDDATGRRVRNLLNVQPVTNRTLTMTWDGRNDDGQPVAPGTYTVRGVSHSGFGAKYQYAWYNPGQPPWEGYPNSGWGGDHAGAGSIVAVPPGLESPWHVIIGGELAEAGDAVFALDARGRKVWSFKRGWSGARSLAVGDGQLYLALPEPNAILRFDLASGRPAPFQRTAGLVNEINLDAPVHSLAVGPAALVALLRTEPPQLVFFDKTTGRAQRQLPATGLGQLAYDPTGRLWFSGAGRLATLDEAGTPTPVTLPGLERPGAFCFDASGALFVMDEGTDWQVKVYGPPPHPDPLPTGERGSPPHKEAATTYHFLRAIGTRGGQGKRLAYDPHAMQSVVSAVTVDRDGLVWTTEPAHPRRQAVWDGAGRLVRDYVGSTQYGAHNCTLHEQDPTRATAYGILFEIDPGALAAYRPIRFLSSGPRPGSPFEIPRGYGPVGHFFHRGTLFRSNASGQPREYYLDTSSSRPVLYLDIAGDYRPVAAVIGGDGGVFQFWSDRNGDELVQPEETQELPFRRAPIEYYDMSGGISFLTGWTFPITEDLTFYVSGLAIRPVGFTANGAPLYDLARAEPLGEMRQPQMSALARVGRHLVGHAHTPHRPAANPQSPYLASQYWFADLTGRVVATFPMPGWGVHGSAHLPPPPAGQTAGELLLAGSADLGGAVGSVFAVHGNYGQVFLFTEDGIFLGTLFRDVREPHTGYGATVARGADWSAVTMTQEPFSGWFGKQSDGKVRYLFGRNAALVVEITGLDQIRRFTAGKVVISGSASP